MNTLSVRMFHLVNYWFHTFVRRIKCLSRWNVNYFPPRTLSSPTRFSYWSNETVRTRNSQFSLVAVPMVVPTQFLLRPYRHGLRSTPPALSQPSRLVVILSSVWLFYFPLLVYSHLPLFVSCSPLLGASLMISAPVLGLLYVSTAPDSCVLALVICRLLEVFRLGWGFHFVSTPRLLSLCSIIHTLLKHAWRLSHVRMAPCWHCSLFSR